MSFSIVIPSRNVQNLTACVRALREHGENSRVLVIWDSEDGIAGEDKDVYVLNGTKPFCFARNANTGIQAAGSDDVLLLNDDALLETNRGFSALAGVSASTLPPFGIVSATVRGPANWAHSVHRATGDLDVVGRVPFVAVYIPRAVIRRVGLLDERFAPGGYEDDDYCVRTSMAGFRVGVSRNCVVDHGTLPHTFRPAGKRDLYDLPANAQRFAGKWRTE
jgi:GT2 family glycosyltransferase